MRDGPARRSLTTLRPLPSLVIAVYFNEDVLVVATQCQGAAVWRFSSELVTDTPPDVLLACGGAMIGLCVLGEFVISPCTDATIRVWKRNNPVCLTLGGLRNRSPRCCGARSLAGLDAIVVVVPDGDGGILLWPIDSTASMSDALGLDSRCAKRLPNRSGTTEAIDVVSSGMYTILVAYNDGSLSTFRLSIDEKGLDAILVHTCLAQTSWKSVNLTPGGNHAHTHIYATRADSPTSLLLIWALPPAYFNSDA